MTAQDPSELIAGGIAIVMLLGGFVLLGRQLRDKGLGPYTMQLAGLIFLVPTVLLLGVLTDVSAEAIITLVGVLVGYVFGAVAVRQ